MLSFEGNASLFCAFGQLFQMKPVSSSLSAGLVRALPSFRAGKNVQADYRVSHRRRASACKVKCGRSIFVPCPPKLEVTG